MINICFSLQTMRKQGWLQTGFHPGWIHEPRAASSTNTEAARRQWWNEIPETAQTKCLFLYQSKGVEWYQSVNIFPWPREPEISAESVCPHSVLLGRQKAEPTMLLRPGEGTMLSCFCELGYGVAFSLLFWISLFSCGKAWSQGWEVCGDDFKMLCQMCCKLWKSWQTFLR